MSEREIKPGSTWRNVHGEVTVTWIGPDPHSSSYQLVTSKDTDGACCQMCSKNFRATHEWVRDAVELPKVGTWWRLKGDSVRKSGNPLCVMKLTEPLPDSFVILHAFGDYTEANTKHFTRDFEPCDPPPLVKALDGLIDNQSTYTGYTPTDVHKVATEWRKIKESIK